MFSMCNIIYRSIPRHNIYFVLNIKYYFVRTSHNHFVYIRIRFQYPVHLPLGTEKHLLCRKIRCRAEHKKGPLRSARKGKTDMGIKR